MSSSCSIKIHDLSDLKEMSAIINLDDERTLDRMEWTDDGQLLAVTSTKGNLYVYLTSLPLLSATQQTRIAHLTSLLEVTIEDNIQQASSCILSVLTSFEFYFFIFLMSMLAEGHCII